MSYMNQNHAQLVQLPCVCCGRPLIDAESMARLIGPDCFKKYGQGLTHLSNAERQEANKMILELGKLDNALEIEGQCMAIGSKFPSLAGLKGRVLKRFAGKIKKAKEEAKSNMIMAVGTRLYFPYKKNVKVGPMLRQAGFKCRGSLDNGKYFWVIEKPTDVTLLKATIEVHYPNFKVLNTQGQEVALEDHLKVVNTDPTPRMTMKPENGKMLVNLSKFDKNANQVLKGFGARALYEAQKFQGWLMPVNTPWDMVVQGLENVYGETVAVS